MPSPSTLPANYGEARREFLALALEAGASIRRFYHDDGSADPDRLSTDVAYLGPVDSRVMVVIASGTHGIEGYAGSACQFRFLRDYGSRYAESGLSFLLVHAVNPWGYLNDRRVTLEGVDLNRNFVDFPLDANESPYDAYHDRLVTKYRPLPAGWWNELCLMSGALSASRRRAIQAAVTAGQHRYADGLFFIGQAAARSRVVWERIVDVYTPLRECVFLLDLHTGLGKNGVGELISYLPSSSDDFRLMSSWFGGELKSMASGESVSAAIEGTLTAAFDRRVAAQSYAVGLEFGTIAPLAVLNAMRADHWYHRHVGRLASHHREWVRRKMKAAFAPANASWHAQITARFGQVLDRMVAALKSRLPASE